MIEIIIFAIVAFIIYKKLFSAFGDTKYDRDLSQDERGKIEDFKKSISTIIESKKKQLDQIEIVSGLEASHSPEDREVFDIIRKSDPAFNADKFIKGAKSAFEMVLNAFTHGEKDLLKQLLDQELYKNFENEIDNRNLSQQQHEVTLVGIKNCEILSAMLSARNSIASIEVRFLSEQIKIVKDKISGELLGGSQNTILRIDEIWTFEKDLRVKENMWKLVAVTSNEQE